MKEGKNASPDASGRTVALTEKLFKRLKSLTADNLHGESYLEAAQALGLPQLVERFARINSEQLRLGHLSPDLECERRNAYTQLMQQARQLLSPQQGQRLYLCF